MYQLILICIKPLNRVINRTLVVNEFHVSNEDGRLDDLLTELGYRNINDRKDWMNQMSVNFDS